MEPVDISLFCPTPPEVLFYYCSAEVFKSIVVKQELWLTDFSKISLSLEQNQLGYEKRKC